MIVVLTILPWHNSLRCSVSMALFYAPVSLSPLRLKLFGLDDEPLSRWFIPVIHAETYVLNEVFAYDKLLPRVRYYRDWLTFVRQFTLSDGTLLSGLLMEYIEGWNLDSSYSRGLTRTLTPDGQIKMVRVPK